MPLGDVAVALDVHGVNAAEYIPSRTTHSERMAIATIVAQCRQRDKVLRSRLSADGPAPAAQSCAGDRYCNRFRNRDGYKITRENIAARNPRSRRLVEWNASQPLTARPILLDVGHNPAGAWALRSSPSETRIAICRKSSSSDVYAIEPMRNHRSLQILFPLVRLRVSLTPVDSPRSATLNELIAAARYGRILRSRYRLC